jgi:hypothetical protein
MVQSDAQEPRWPMMRLRLASDFGEVRNVFSTTQ